ncbi:MAG: GNAT family N-acetyltransferase [Pseudoruegeria sp.]
MPPTVIKARRTEDIEIARALVWEFFDHLRIRYTDMLEIIDTYLEEQDVAGQLINFNTFFLPPAGECLLATIDDVPVGLVMLRPHGENDGEINRMYVRDTARGLGLGRALGVAIIDEARTLGYKTLWLDGLNRHVEALPLYESLGFEYYTDSNAFGGDDERVIHMRLAL